MPKSKPTRIKSKKKKRRFLMTLKKCWIIEDKLLPLYSHLIDCYSDQLLKDPFGCETIEVKPEPRDDSLESLPSADSNNHFEVIMIFPITWYVLAWQAVG